LYRGEQECSRLDGLGLLAEEVPGFAVLVEVVGAVGAAASFGALVAEEGEGEGSGEGLDGDDVPEAFGDDVGGEDIPRVGHEGVAASVRGSGGWWI
jgi:hypothetical protein